ncbi:MAG: hypothetical protein ACM362_02140 [Candidatus Methylomirabilota bacterium]
MAAEVDDQGFILSIHNYCDRWCERCPFTSRCRVYAMEMTIQVDGFDGELARAAESLPADPVEEWADEDFLAGAEDSLSEEEIEQELLARDVADAIAEVHPLTESADGLAKLAKPLIDAAEIRVTAGGSEAEASRNPLEVLARYKHFVAVKVRRALSGRDTPPILDEDGHPFPSDADGSARIAYLTCAAARDAAQRLAMIDPGLASLVAPFTQTADRVLALIDEAFPGHRTFRRPGFDDPPPSTHPGVSSPPP